MIEAAEINTNAEPEPYNKLNIQSLALMYADLVHAVAEIDDERDDEDWNSGNQAREAIEITQGKREDFSLETFEHQMPRSILIDEIQRMGAYLEKHKERLKKEDDVTGKTMAECLEFMRESGAGLHQQIIRRKSDDKPEAAIIIVDGEEESAEILAAIDEVSKDW